MACEEKLIDSWYYLFWRSEQILFDNMLKYFITWKFFTVTYIIQWYLFNCIPTLPTESCPDYHLKMLICKYSYFQWYISTWNVRVHLPFNYFINNSRFSYKRGGCLQMKVVRFHLHGLCLGALHAWKSSNNRCLNSSSRDLFILYS